MKKFSDCLNRFGRRASAVNEYGDVLGSAKCFIQALRYKNKMYLEGTPTDIGMNNSGYYLFIGPPDFPLEDTGDSGYITDGEKKYHIDRWEKVHAGEDVFYLWAVLKEHTGGRYPIYDHFR